VAGCCVRSIFRAGSTLRGLVLSLRLSWAVLIGAVLRRGVLMGKDRVCDYGYIEINAYPAEDDKGISYDVYLDFENYNGDREVLVEMSKADLVNFRNMVHNLLLDLNNKLGE
jgi:hypothetical protein